MDLKLRALLLDAISPTALRKGGVGVKEEETRFSGKAPTRMVFTCQWEDLCLSVCLFLNHDIFVSLIFYLTNWITFFGCRSDSKLLSSR